MAMRSTRARDAGVIEGRVADHGYSGPEASSGGVAGQADRGAHLHAGIYRLEGRHVAQGVAADVRVHRVGIIGREGLLEEGVGVGERAALAELGLPLRQRELARGQPRARL